MSFLITTIIIIVIMKILIITIITMCLMVHQTYGDYISLPAKDFMEDVTLKGIVGRS